MTVPAGTIMLVQLVDTLDTSNAQTGQIFSATLATNLLANGYVVARIGTPVYGQVVYANSAGRATGKSKLQLQLTQIVIGGNPVPIVTDTFDTEGKAQDAGRPAGFSAARGWERPSVPLQGTPAWEPRLARWREAWDRSSKKVTKSRSPAKRFCSLVYSRG